MTSGQARPGGLISAAAAPPRLILSVICQYWSEREGGDYQKLSSTASLQSSNLNFRLAGIRGWRLARVHLRNIDNNTRPRGGEDVSCVTRTG